VVDAILNDGVPQGGMLSPLLYNFFVSDQLISPNTSADDYTDDKVLTLINEHPGIAYINLQTHLDLIANWCTK